MQSLSLIALYAAGTLAQSSSMSAVTTTFVGFLDHGSGPYEASVLNVQSGLTTLSGHCQTNSCNDDPFLLTLGGSTFLSQTATTTLSSTTSVMTTSCSVLPSTNVQPTVQCLVTGSVTSGTSTGEAVRTDAMITGGVIATFVITGGQEKLPATSTSATGAVTSTSSGASTGTTHNAASRATAFSPGAERGFFMSVLAMGVLSLILATML